MSEKRVFKSPEDRVFLTIDFEEGYRHIRDIIHTLGSRVHAVKLGQAYLFHPRRVPMTAWLKGVSISTYLDLKSHVNADESRSTTARIADLGHDYASIHAGSEVSSLAAAAKSAGGLILVAALSALDGEVKEDELEHIQEVNELLPEGQRISALMCNVSQLKHTEQLGGILRVATGIRLPGDSTNDQPAVSTPCEALELGADMLAIGRVVTAAEDKQRAYGLVLENMAQAQ